MFYGGPNEDQCSPGTVTIQQVQPGTSRAQPAIPGVERVMVVVMVDDHFAHGLVMEVD